MPGFSLLHNTRKRAIFLKNFDLGTIKEIETIIVKPSQPEEMPLPLETHLFLFLRPKPKQTIIKIEILGLEDSVKSLSIFPIDSSLEEHREEKEYSLKQTRAYFEKQYEGYEKLFANHIFGVLGQMVIFFFFFLNVLKILKDFKSHSKNCCHRYLPMFSRAEHSDCDR